MARSTLRSLPIAALVSLALLTPAALAAQPPPGAPGGPPPGQPRSGPAPPPNTPAPPPHTLRTQATGSHLEALVLSGMHLMNRTTIEAANLATQKGSTYRIRMLGDRLARDHGAADRRVISYANAHGFALMSAGQLAQALAQVMPASSAASDGLPSPAERLQQMQQMTQRLQALQGPAFDRAFTTFVADSQLGAVRLLTIADQRLPSGSRLRALVSRAIPILEQHYRIASNLRLETVARTAQGGQ